MRVPRGWKRDGAGCRFPPRRLWDGIFAEGRLLSLEKPSGSRQTPLARGGKPVLMGGEGPWPRVFGGKLRHGAGQSPVLPSPSHGRWRGHGDASVTVSGLSHGSEGVLGFGTHTHTHARAGDLHPAWLSPAAPSRAAVGFPALAAWHGAGAWGGGGESLPRCSRWDPRGQDAAVGDTEGSASRTVEGTFRHSDRRSGHPKSLPSPPAPFVCRLYRVGDRLPSSGLPVPGSCPLSLGGAVKRNLLFLFISAKARQRGLPR